MCVCVCLINYRCEALNLHPSTQSTRAALLTSLWFREAFVQMKNHFLHKVLDVAVLWSSHKHHPVVGEPFHRGFLSDLGTMTKFQFHLHSTLQSTKTQG